MSTAGTVQFILALHMPHLHTHHLLVRSLSCMYNIWFGIFSSRGEGCVWGAVLCCAGGCVVWRPALLRTHKLVTLSPRPHWRVEFCPCLRVVPGVLPMHGSPVLEPVQTLGFSIHILS